MIEEMKSRSAAIRQRIDRVDGLLVEIDRMRRLDIVQARGISMSGGCTSTVVADDLLQDVLRRGIAAAIEAREIEIVDLLAADRAVCPACGGLGSPAGEAAGLICGNCIGTGLSPLNEPD